MIAMIREDQRRWAGRLVSSALVFVCLPAASQAAAQEREPGAVVLYGEIPEPIVLTSEALAALPQVTVRGTPHGGDAGTWHARWVRQVTCLRIARHQ
jgi:hypothetical protein